MGLQDRDVTLAEFLKTKGYRTGQFGKNHLGDKDKHLPTQHGFDEFTRAAQKFIRKADASGQPFFVWMNTVGMHFRTHTKAGSLGRSGQGFYNDTMMDHDDIIGSMLNQLDTLKIADNTIVIYTTDNGVHFNTWPDAGITPFCSEKNSNWEGAYRVPAMVRWPGKIKPGQASNEISRT